MITDSELFDRTHAVRANEGEKMYNVLIAHKDLPAVSIWVSAKNSKEARKVAHEWTIRILRYVTRSYSLTVIRQTEDWSS